MKKNNSYVLDSSKDSEDGVDKSFEDLENLDVDVKNKPIKDVNFISNAILTNKRRLTRLMYKKLHSEINLDKYIFI